MSTVIDALVVTLGLDNSDYKKGVAESVELQKKLSDQLVKLQKSTEEQNKKTGESFNKVRNQVAGFFAALLGLKGLKEFISSNIEGQAALSRLSQNLDLSARRLDAWGIVAKEMGGQASDSLGALQAISAGLAEATIKGHSALTDAARANGVALTDEKGKLLSNEEILLRFSARMQQLPRQQAIALANMAGIGGIANQLLLGPQELRARLAAAEQLSRVTQESADRAAKLERKWTDLKERFRGIGELIFEKLEPILLRLADKAAKWAEKIDWDKVVAKGGQFLQLIDRLVERFGGWEVAGIAVASMLGLKLLAPLAGVVGLVGRLTGLLPAAAAGFTSLGAAATVALTALTAVAALHIDSLGGKQRADGSYEDERPRPTGAGPSNADLWAKVQGKTSTFTGSRDQAAMLLAGRMYVDSMSQETYQKAAADILAGKVAPETAGNAAPEAAKTQPPTTLPAPSSAAQASSTSGQSGPIQELFARLEAQNGLPPGTLDAVWNKESHRSTGAITSPAGAQGPFQFMPATAAEYGLVGDDVNDVTKSATGAARYLGRLREKFGDIRTALGAYNWGPGNVEKYGLANAPAETRDYMTLADQLQVGPPQRFGGGASAAAGKQVSNETHIGTIQVVTRATDAQGIARDLPRAIQDQSLVSAADSGVE